MIISRTPLRISFCGGGTDFEGYYKERGGAVVSAAINKYIYVGVNRLFGGKIRVRWTKNETVDYIGELEHYIAREALRMTGIDRAIEIEITSDIPSRGSGLGSSSTLTVGLLKALYRYKGYDISAEELARKASSLEIDVLNSPIGRQDQYAAAYGGLNYIIFNQDNTVTVENLYRDAMGSKIKWLQDSTMLFYLHARDANNILIEHKKAIKDNLAALDDQRLLAVKFKKWLLSQIPKHKIAGDLITESWACKKRITPNTTSEEIDKLFRKIKRKGALGGKLCGAGGGGFLMVVCEDSLQQTIKYALKDYLCLKFDFEREGSKIIYAD